ncbi:MAG: MFS transporter [Rickettsia sp.]|nr:MFS transporter [Rickettsia sp.]
MSQNSRVDTKFVFFSSILGNILEYYDFTVYAVFSIQIGKTFFPQNNELVQILLSLAVFAVGFITRPIGGIVFGIIGDRWGRKKSLMISMLGMTIPTFVMGVIPSYETIGLYSTILLIMMRLIQGFCISGEGAGAAIFILEHQQNLKPGVTAGLVHSANIAGSLLAAFVGIVIEKFFYNEIYAWRFAFVLGSIMGIFGLYFRIKVTETPIFLMINKKRNKIYQHFSDMIKISYLAVIITFFTGACASSVVYLVKSYFNVYYVHILGYEKTISLYLLFYSSFIMMISMPIAGYVSDQIGRYNAIRLFVFFLFIIILPAFYVMSLQPYNIILQVLMLSVEAIAAGLISGGAYIFVISLFKSHLRFLGVSFSYNFGVAIFGGTSAMISSWLVTITGLNYAPAFYVMFTSFILLILVVFLKRNIKRLILDNRHEIK